MKKINERYIETVKCEDIPWHRLTTVYKRATDFPDYFKILSNQENMEDVRMAMGDIAINIEHQSTLWHCTPFALIFLSRIFKNTLDKKEGSKAALYILESLSTLFYDIELAVKEINKWDNPLPLPFFKDLLREEYLWSEVYDPKEDELRYDEGDVFPHDLFYSFYYYSHEVLLRCRPLLHNLNIDKPV